MKHATRKATPEQHTLFKKVQQTLPFVSGDIIWERILGGTEALACLSAPRLSFREYQELWHNAPEGSFLEEQIAAEWESVAQLEMRTRIQRAHLNGYSDEEQVEYLRSLYLDAPPKGETRRMIVRHIISLLSTQLAV